MYLTIIIHIINQPTEVTIVKPDGERVSQADLKAAAEAAEAARIASAKAEEERLQAERLAAEQLAAQKSMNGTTSPSNMQDIKVHSLLECYFGNIFANSFRTIKNHSLHFTDVLLSFSLL